MTYHTNEEPGLLSGTPDTCITDDTDSETGGETGKTDGKTSTELNETSVQWHRRCDCLSASQVNHIKTAAHTITRDQDRNDETVLNY
jgi:hypothetical protein